MGNCGKSSGRTTIRQCKSTGYGCCTQYRPSFFITRPEAALGGDSQDRPETADGFRARSLPKSNLPPRLSGEEYHRAIWRRGLVALRVGIAAVGEDRKSFVENFARARLANHSTSANGNGGAGSISDCAAGGNTRGQSIRIGAARWRPAWEEIHCTLATNVVSAGDEKSILEANEALFLRRR